MSNPWEGFTDMTVRSTHLKLIGAAGAAALAIGTVASPALAAASTASVTYTCSTPLGDAHPSSAYSVASAPTKMAVGQPLKTTGTFTLDAQTTGLATLGLGWSTFKGSITTKPSAGQAGLALTFPKTPLGNGPGGTTNASAKGATLAGTRVGAFTFKLGDLGRVVLTGYDASGAKAGQAIFPTAGSYGKCMNDAGTTTLMSGATAVTTKIVKDTTKTTESAAYKAKTKKAISKAKVKSHFGTPATGKVTFILKKGTHKVKTLTGKINKKGVAKVVFKGVKAKGKYSITAKYAGSKTLKGSSGKDTFRVK
jgi:hypothetical protein